jgi:hypothetical protein
VQNVLCSSLLSKNVDIHIHRTVILLFVLCGSETWSFTLREAHTLRVFENSRVLRGILGSKKEVFTGELRKLYFEQLRDLYCAPDIIRVNKSRRIRWAGRVARMRRKQKIHTEFW